MKPPLFLFIYFSLLSVVGASGELPVAQLFVHRSVSSDFNLKHGRAVEDAPEAPFVELRQEGNSRKSHLIAPVGSLLPDRYYRVSVSYEFMIESDIESELAPYAYVSVSSNKKGAKWFPMYELHQSSSGKRSRDIYILMPPKIEDYELAVRIKGEATLHVYDLAIVELPRINADVEPEVFEGVESRAYEPYGIDTHFGRIDKPGLPWGFDEKEVRKGIHMCQEMGAQWIRFGVTWPQLQPRAERKFDAEQMNRFRLNVRLAKEAGLRILFELQAIPKWASRAPEGVADSWAYAPENIDDWRFYVQTVVDAVGEDVDAWIVLNEPNWLGWRDTFESYMDLAKVAREIVKAKNGEALFVSSGMANAGLDGIRMHGGKTSRPWAIEAMATLGFGEVFDVLAVHLYYDTAEEMIYGVNRWMQILDSLNMDMPIWITETGQSVFKGVSEEMQAAHLKEIYEKVLNHPRVDKLFNYNFVQKDWQKERAPREYGFGLVKGDFTPRPSYEVYKNLEKRQVRMVNWELQQN